MAVVAQELVPDFLWAALWSHSNEVLSFFLEEGRFCLTDL